MVIIVKLEVLQSMLSLRKVATCALLLKLLSDAVAVFIDQAFCSMAAWVLTVP